MIHGVRLHVLSDLHLEFDWAAPESCDADVVVLAGDIALGTAGVQWAAAWVPDRPVLYVAGNHEFYGHSFPGLIAELRDAAAGSTVRVLEDDEIVIDGVRFLGCTLWSDFDFDGVQRRDASMRISQMAVRDYRLIQWEWDGRTLEPADTRATHLRSRIWLAERLAEPFDGPTVVITHHQPLITGRPPTRALRAVAGAFVSDLDSMMGSEREALWVYGHTHRPADLEVRGTRVLSNPRGYPHEPVAAFDPEMIVEV